MLVCRFFFHDTATPEIYTLSLHDALPICFRGEDITGRAPHAISRLGIARKFQVPGIYPRSEEHTSELQSLTNLVCRLLREKKNLAQSASARAPRVAFRRNSNAQNAGVKSR